MTISRLDQTMADIKLGETRVLERVAEPSVDKNRWYLFAENGDFTPPGLFQWINYPDSLSVPHAEHSYCGKLSIHDIPTPALEFVGRPEQLADMYPVRDGFFVSERVFRVFQALDPEGIDSIELPVKGANCSYHYCLCTRSLRALDERTTTIIVTKTLVTFKDYLFSIAEDVAACVHCFTLFHHETVLLSRQLVQAIIDSGARGSRFLPPFLPSQSEHTIRI